MKTQIFKPLLLASVALLMMACNRPAFYDESLSLNNDLWPKDEALTFKVNITDTASAYRFFINVRNSTTYQYKNIYFFLSTEFPDGAMAKDTIECLLAARDGSWLGKGSGKYRDNRIFIRENINFPQKGTFTFRLNQAMRHEVLKGISEAGIRLEQQ
ncbi:MAG: gliding motility lipoprotein GldH [Lentimicrobiaceae bacterium]|nr:gliding motility lipoprotein GldH [Lentimicrobiaceae bacterium]